MIIVMETGCDDKDLENIQGALRKSHLKGHLVKGGDCVYICVTALPGTPALVEQAPEETLKALARVEEIIPVSKPYKLASREFHPTNTTVRVPVPRVSSGYVAIGGEQVVMMAGPCAVESEKQLMTVAENACKAGAVILRGGAFKPSTSPYSFRGLGEAGLKLLAKARQTFGMAVITEVMTPADISLVSEYTDIFQIGARNMQNYMLLDEIGKSSKPVMLKRGMSATIEEWLLAAEYILSQGNMDVILCERGIRTFEKATRNTMDISAIPLIKRMSHLPVVADPSQGTGRDDLVTPMSLAALAAGADGLLIEVHPRPAEALKDGAQSLTLEQFQTLMPQACSVVSAIGREFVTFSSREQKGVQKTRTVLPSRIPDEIPR